MGGIKVKKILGLITTIILCLTLIIPSTAAYADQLNLGIKSYLVIDAETGYVLYQDNADQAFAPASITKIMTMYLIFEALENGQISIDDMVIPSEQVRSVQHPENTQLFLVPGREFPVKELISAIAVPSASDAAIAMGEHIAGSEQDFVALMNERARELGLTNTNFVNPHGLDAPGHVMSARDIAILSQRLIMEYPQVLQYSSQQVYTPPAWHVDAFGNKFYPLPSTFRSLLRNNVGVIDGLKTGYTTDAGFSMSVTANIAGRRYIIVVMGAESQAHRQSIIENIIRSEIPANFQTVRVTEESDIIDNLSIPRAHQTYVPVGTLKNVALVVPRTNPEAEQVVTINEGIRAPLNAGDEVGKVTYYVEGQAVHTAAVYALEDVPQANIFVRIIRGFVSIFTGAFNWIKNTFF